VHGRGGGGGGEKSCTRIRTSSPTSTLSNLSRSLSTHYYSYLLQKGPPLCIEGMKKRGSPLFSPFLNTDSILTRTLQIEEERRHSLLLPTTTRWWWWWAVVGGGGGGGKCAAHLCVVPPTATTHHPPPITTTLIISFCQYMNTNSSCMVRARVSMMSS
jgi:hypothetical protein